MLNVLRDAPHSKARFVALGVHSWAAAVAQATQSALEPAFSEARRAVQALALDPCEQVTWKTLYFISLSPLCYLSCLSVLCPNLRCEQAVSKLGAVPLTADAAVAGMQAGATF